MSINLRQTLDLMKKAGWTPQLFAESFNSTARAEAHATYIRTHRVPDVIPQIDLATAKHFFATGAGIDGDGFDILERWAERRTSFSNGSGTVFSPPMAKQSLTTITPPLLFPVEVEQSQEGPDIVFSDITNTRARAKMLGRSGVS